MIIPSQFLKIRSTVGPLGDLFERNALMTRRHECLIHPDTPAIRETQILVAGDTLAVALAAKHAPWAIRRFWQSPA